MSMYQLPEFKPPKISIPKMFLLNSPGGGPNKGLLLVLVISISFIFGALGGAVTGSYFYSEVKEYLGKLNINIPEVRIIGENEYVPQTTREELIIRAVKQVSPSVVSIIATKDVPVYEAYYIDPFGDFLGQPFGFQIPEYRQKGTEKQTIGSGTGFIISSDGMVLTNSHVVSDKGAEYTIFTNEGKELETEVLARDPVADLAIVKIKSFDSFDPLKLGDSDELQPGQTVIAIGNALGEFRNTISVGVISGLRRTITASGSGITEVLEDIIQTDAAINPGNSGGPLLNLKGEVIGINVAMSQGAENIGFAIPVNNAKRNINQIKTSGKITYPFLGVRYTLVTPVIQEKNDLPVDYGAWVIKGSRGEAAVMAGSAAEQAGIKEGDIILRFNGEIINPDNSLARIIREYEPGDEAILRVLREEQELNLKAVLQGKDPEDW